MECYRRARSKTPLQTGTADRRHQPCLSFPEATVFLVGEKPMQLATGSFELFDSDPAIIQVGCNFRWLLTSDQTVSKLDDCNYFFYMPMKDGCHLNYLASFAANHSDNLKNLDNFLRRKSKFFVDPEPSKLDWKEFAPSVDDYHGLLAKAIAVGTGHLIHGIFLWNDVYSNTILRNDRNRDEYRGMKEKISMANDNGVEESDESNACKTLKRMVRLSELAEKLSKSTLNGACAVSGSSKSPLPASQSAKGSIPKEAIGSSLDAIGSLLNAIEASEKHSISATSKATSRIVSNRCGKGAGEAVEDVFGIVGRCVGISWNLFRIWKVFRPSSFSNLFLRNAPKNKKKK